MQLARHPPTACQKQNTVLTKNTFAIRENGQENVTHPEFEWSYALEVAVPQVLNQLPISLGHHTTHSQGVVPAISINHI